MHSHNMTHSGRSSFGTHSNDGVVIFTNDKFGFVSPQVGIIGNGRGNVVNIQRIILPFDVQLVARSIFFVEIGVAI